MEKRTILIVTDDFDPHADDVIVQLRNEGHNPVRLNLRTMPRESTLSLSISNSHFSGTIHSSKGPLPLHEIHSVWWRKSFPPARNPELDKNEATFALSELRYALRGLWANMDCYWLSHPSNLDRAEDKVSQLRRAKALGMSIPKTLITTKQEEVWDFFRSCDGKIIYKTLNDPSIGATQLSLTDQNSSQLASGPDAKWVYTSTVSEQMLREHGDKLHYVPSLFQERLDKAYELRVTVVEDEVFVAKIDSQAQERTQLDWRHYDVPMLMTPGKLPPGLAEKCVELVRSFHLNYSAIDFIVTPDGEHVFLESNPNGQWLFVEAMIPSFKLVEKISSCLIRGKTSPEQALRRRELSYSEV